MRRGREKRSCPFEQGNSTYFLAFGKPSKPQSFKKLEPVQNLLIIRNLGAFAALPQKMR
jgi:hypothetical protein